ncbi:hypothetical protein [Chitinophaga varians]|uniref:hypothetical protein n=1 Tax=Chitinophaga varians TaxID=2202339 RepID=UPI003CCD8AC6
MTKSLNIYAFFSALGAAAAAAFLVLAVLVLPKDLLKILPLLVFTSPLPITNNLKFVVLLKGCYQAAKYAKSRK